MRSLLIVFAVALIGCGTTSVTRVTVTDRPDSLLVRGDSVGFTAPSTSLIVDTVYCDTLYVPAPDQPPMRSGTGRPLFSHIAARIDTTVHGIRMAIEHTYPPDRWSVIIKNPDSLIRWSVRDSIIERPYPVQEIPFIVYLIIGVMGLALIALIAWRR